MNEFNLAIGFSKKKTLRSCFYLVEKIIKSLYFLFVGNSAEVSSTTGGNDGL